MAPGGRRSGFATFATAAIALMQISSLVFPISAQQSNGSRVVPAEGYCSMYGICAQRSDGKVLNCANATKAVKRIMEEEKVWMASYNLEDVAQMWYYQLREDEGVPGWNHFKDLLQLRFGPPLRSAPLFELAECRRTGTVEEYQNRFQALLPRAGPLQEKQRVELFTGDDTDRGYDLRSRGPPTFNDKALDRNPISLQKKYL